MEFGAPMWTIFNVMREMMREPNRSITFCNPRILLGQVCHLTQSHGGFPARLPEEQRCPLERDSPAV